MAADRLAETVRPFEKTITRAGLLTVLAALLWLVMAAAMATVFGTLLDGTATLRTLMIAAAVFLAAGALRVSLGWVAAGLLDRAGDSAIARERALVIAGQDWLSPRSARLASASVGALLVDKLPQIAPYLRRYRPAAMRVAIVPAALLLAALTFSWSVALILLFAGPLIPLFMALVGLAARDASARQMEEIGSLSGLLVERLSALTDIRLLDAQKRMLSDFEDRSDRLRDRTMAVLRVAFLSSAVLELFSALGVAMVAVYVGFALLGELQFGAWSTPLTPAEGVFLLMIAPEFFQPLRDLAAAWHDKAGALAVAGELAELETTDARTILGSGRAGETGHVAPEIALSAVTLGGLAFPDLHVSSGDAVAITGPSGSGKSTLMSLIGGLDAQGSGAIQIDGTILTEETADDWRGRVAWVPQATEFPSGTLRDMLLLGAPANTTDEDIAAALKLASADAVVARLPGGLDTTLGDTGGGVSGGEARRLLLARAALSGRPVLLADEPTADLDPDTAAEVIGALRCLSATGMTIIVASHDPALISVMARRIDLGQNAERAS